eukprot:754649-Hanusia_phi.AAC.1
MEAELRRAKERIEDLEDELKRASMYKNVHESLIQSLQCLLTSHLDKVNEVKNADLISQKCSPSAVRKLLERIDSTLAHVDKVLYEDKKGEGNVIKARPSDIHQQNQDNSTDTRSHTSAYAYSPIVTVPLKPTSESPKNMIDSSFAERSWNESQSETSFHRQSFHPSIQKDSVCGGDIAVDNDCYASSWSEGGESLTLKSGFAFESIGCTDVEHDTGSLTAPNVTTPTRSSHSPPNPMIGESASSESKKVISLIASEQPSQRTISISPYASASYTNSYDLHEPETKMESSYQPVIHPTGMPISYLNVENQKQFSRYSSYSSSGKSNLADNTTSTDTRSLPLQIVSNHSTISRPTSIRETNLPKYRYKEVQMYQADKENLMNFSRVRTYVRGPHYVI